MAFPTTPEKIRKNLTQNNKKNKCMVKARKPHDPCKRKSYVRPAQSNCIRNINLISIPLSLRDRFHDFVLAVPTTPQKKEKERHTRQKDNKMYGEKRNAYDPRKQKSL